MDSDFRYIIETLVGFETTPDRSNRPLIDWIADRLESICKDVDVLPSEDGTKANLLTRIGPPVSGGIVLSGHSDVVTTEGQEWRFEPFKVTEEDEYLYGRGTVDMKGFISLLVSLAPFFADLPLKKPIYFALSHDEENGCQGIPALVDHLMSEYETPELAIIGEPTKLEMVTSHKSMHLFRSVISGKEAHSSTPHLGANANIAAGKLLAFLDKYFENLREKYPHDHRFDVPYCTYNIGRLNGGIATSLIANLCHVDWEFRALPSIPPDAILRDIETYIADELLPELQQNHINSEIDLNCWAQVPALQHLQSDALVCFANCMKMEGGQKAVSYGTEAGFFQQAGMSAIVCGPGSIAQAHQADEFISIEQLVAGKELLKNISSWLCE